MAAGLTFTPDIAEAKHKLFDINCQGGWLVVGYSGAKSLELQATGNGDVNEMVDSLIDDQIQYVLMRLQKDKLLHDVSKSPTKDVFMTWIGPNVNRMDRGKKKGDVPDVSAALQPHHVDLEAINRKKITNEVVRERTFGAGSHIID